MGVPARSRASSLSLRLTQHPFLGAGLYLHPDAGPDGLAENLRPLLLEVYLPRQLGLPRAAEPEDRVPEVLDVLPGLRADGRYAELEGPNREHVPGFRRFLPPRDRLVEHGYLRKLRRGSGTEQDQEPPLPELG